MRSWEYCMVSAGGPVSVVVSFRVQGSEWRHIEPDPGRGERTAAEAVPRVIAELGLEGWELVNALPVITPEGASTDYFFKRPLSELSPSLSNDRVATIEAGGEE